jgi:hypothetical protein
VRLAVELREADGSLHEWYGEKITSGLLGGLVTPDGYGVLHLPGRAPLHLLLEPDRGTEPLRRIREKVDRYAKTLPRSELTDTNPLVLFAAPTSRSAAGVSNALTGSNKSALRMFAAAWSPASRERLLQSTLAGSRIRLR